MQASIEGGQLVLRLDIETPLLPSKSGKTQVVATSHGNKTTEVVVEGQRVVVGVNAYIYPAKSAGTSSAQPDAGDQSTSNES